MNAKINALLADIENKTRSGAIKWYLCNFSTKRSEIWSATDDVNVMVTEDGIVTFYYKSGNLGPVSFKPEDDRFVPFIFEAREEWVGGILDSFLNELDAM